MNLKQSLRLPIGNLASDGILTALLCTKEVLSPLIVHLGSVLISATPFDASELAEIIIDPVLLFGLSTLSFNHGQVKACNFSKIEINILIYEGLNSLGNLLIRFLGQHSLAQQSDDVLIHHLLLFWTLGFVHVQISNSDKSKVSRTCFI